MILIWYYFVMKRQDKIAIVIFIIFYILLGILATFYQEKIIYQPSKQDFTSCFDFKDAEKVEYNGTRMYLYNGERGVVVLYHGNAGSACDRYFYAQQFVQNGYGYIIPEYFGYSNDSREPKHEYIKQDVRNVASYIKKNNYKNIIIIGESIGTGAASFHVSLNKSDKLLLISPFYNLKDIAKRKFWFYPTFLMVNNAFDNSVLLGNYDNPIYIIHGDKDHVISQKSGLKLYNSLISNIKKFTSIKGFGHNDLFMTNETYDVIKEFLN